MNDDRATHRDGYACQEVGGIGCDVNPVVAAESRRPEATARSD